MRPARQFNGAEFTPGTVMCQESGKPLGFVTSLYLFRGDWPAMCEFFCLRFWSHLRHPCLLCRHDLKLLTDIDALLSSTLNPPPDAEFTDADYHAEVRRCTIQITVSGPDVRDAIAQNLTYDSKCLGRCVVKDMHYLGLRAGDRLCPTPQLADVASFAEIPLPMDIEFWRCNPVDDRILGKSPLMLIEGASTDLYGVDKMHAWELGPLQSFIGFILWYFLKSGIFKSNLSWLRAEQEHRVGLNHIKASCFATTPIVGVMIRIGEELGLKLIALHIRGLCFCVGAW